MRNHRFCVVVHAIGRRRVHEPFLFLTLLADHHHTRLLIEDFALQLLEIWSLRRQPSHAARNRLAPQAQKESISQGKTLGRY